jgi:anaerobic ribonucleoside-triphosphate reductase activating protein
MTTRFNKNHISLNVHAFLPLSHANGPGARAVVWVQGCRMHCPGCRNPLTHSHKRHRLLDPGQLAAAILAIPGIEGLTVSGGEPFEQARATADLCLKAYEGGLSVMVFTGWTHHRILACRNPHVRRLISAIDILVDGRFIQDQADKHLLWRGSRNQRILFLTDRNTPDLLYGPTSPVVEARLAAGSPLKITGFPTGPDVQALANRLRKDAGILLEPIPTGPDACALAFQGPLRLGVPMGRSKAGPGGNVRAVAARQVAAPTEAAPVPRPAKSQSRRHGKRGDSAVSANTNASGDQPSAGGDFRKGSCASGRTGCSHPVSQEPNPVVAEAKRRFAICKACEHSLDDGFACRLCTCCCLGKFCVASENHCPAEKW